MLDQPVLKSQQDSFLSRFDSLIYGVLIALVVLGGILGTHWLRDTARRSARAAADAQLAVARATLAEARSKTEAMLGGIKAQRQVRVESDLRSFVVDYQAKTKEMGRPPKSWEEMGGKASGTAPAPTTLSRRRAGWEVTWGQPLPAKAPNAALKPFAWDKEADAAGKRWILFADGETTRQVGAEEFAKLKEGGK